GAGRLSRIDPVTCKVSIVTDGLALDDVLPGAPPTDIFNGVAVGPSGAIYGTTFSNAGESGLYRVDQPNERPVALPRTSESGANAPWIAVSGMLLLVLGLALGRLLLRSAP
ncbi:MAG TPA: hypothetical protein VGJ87_13205, partial [Roseiflexaceae bacterium]